MQVIHKQDLHYGGFAGLKEHRIVMDSSVFGSHKNKGTADGLGSLLYLADAQFNPFGETLMHPHHEVDVITVMIKGSVRHEGSLAHGTLVKAGEVQVQRAGAEGLQHNEINPDAQPNRLIQLWFAPPRQGEKAQYQHFSKQEEQVMLVYGANNGKTFASNTCMEIVSLKKGDVFSRRGSAQMYVTKGVLSILNTQVKDGDFLTTQDISITADEESEFIFISLINQV